MDIAIAQDLCPLCPLRSRNLLSRGPASLSIEARDERGVTRPTMEACLQSSLFATPCLR